MDENFTPETLIACFGDDGDTLIPGSMTPVPIRWAVRRFAAAWRADRKRLAELDRIRAAAAQLVEQWTDDGHVITENEAEDELVAALSPAGTSEGGPSASPGGQGEHSHGG